MRKYLLASVAALAFSGAAFAADLPGIAPAPAPAPIFVGYNWSGFYVGVNAGYVWGESKGNLTIPAGSNINAAAAAEAVVFGNLKHTPDGFTGGITAGYNYQMGSVVLGVEGDINYNGMSGSVTGPVGPIFGWRATDKTSANWGATARVRLGFAADRALFYVTGGAAFTDASVTRFFDNNVDGCPAVGAGFGRCHTGKASFDIGWTAGGGVEYAFTNNWSAKAEYLYADFGKKSFTTLSTNVANQTLRHQFSLTTHTVRVGLNYKFGGPAEAVVAKY